MLTFQKFSGINNVLPPHRLGESELARAVNCDIGLSGELRRRAGFTQLDATCHKNLHERPDGVLLATHEGNALVARAAGGAETTVHPLLGPERVWYCDLPDGRTLFSNGAIAGATRGGAGQGWGVPLPDAVGTAQGVPGSLHPGRYRWALTHVRLADGLEGGAVVSEPVDLPDGGLVLMDLPVLAGHGLRVYLSSRDGEAFYLAGDAVGSMFSFTGANAALALPCATLDCAPLPAGILPAFWRGRVLVARGDVLYASQPHRWELGIPARDFKRFSAPITLVQPANNGIWVGTQQELAFLAGTAFDALAYQQAVPARVVLGSGVATPAGMVRAGEDILDAAMLCIADGVIVAGTHQGGAVRLTESRYATAAVEVSATLRMVDRVPQYLAVPQA
ncbi:hypothetical protein INR38_09155 [Delftia sp. SD018]|uniref:hypothetical protein n=1 Tax=Delftia sp. SD018 TaxID=2781389 RepID=UPI001A977363|nr:hypothetical protein [Delftia sp. SD018]MBO1034253.1 hypothetical protein [Delftia sp. SD018]